MKQKNTPRNAIVALTVAVMLVFVAFPGSSLFASSPHDPAMLHHAKNGKLKAFFKSLKLNEEQKQEAASILKEELPAIDPALDDLIEARLALAQVVQDDDASEEQLRQAAANLATAQETAVLLRDRVRVKLFSVLTDEQKERIEKGREHLTYGVLSKISGVRSFAKAWIYMNAE